MDAIRQFLEAFNDQQKDSSQAPKRQQAHGDSERHLSKTCTEQIIWLLLPPDNSKYNSPNPQLCILQCR